MHIKVRKCGNCKAFIDDETIQCPNCEQDLIKVGVNIELTDKCQVCNAPLKSTGTHCRKCGTRFNPRKHPSWTLP